MSIPVPPTPPTPPGWDFYPDTPGTGGPTTRLQAIGPNFDIVGATDAEADVIEATLFNDPNSDPLGSYVLMTWDWFSAGGAGVITEAIPFITFEFVDPSVVESLSTEPLPFAVTMWDQRVSSTAPAITGESRYGYTYDTINFDDNDPIARVLIRNDLLAGGAGEQWAGPNFLAETVHHELGHVVQGFLANLYGSAYVSDTTCAIFGRPSSAWDSGAWADRVIEASAECFKDVMFPARRYDNRTNVKLPRARFEDFITLYSDYAENSYWDVGNTFYAPLYIQFGISTPDPIVGDGSLPFWAFIPDNDDTVSDFVMNRAGMVRWPTDDLNITLNWNFSPWPLDEDEPFEPPFADIDEERNYYARTWDHISFGVFFLTKAWVQAGFPSPPGLYTLLDGSGNPIYIDNIITPETSPTGAGSLDITLPSGLPEEGFGMMLIAPNKLNGDTPWAEGFIPTTLAGPQLERDYFTEFIGSGTRRPINTVNRPWATYGPMRRPLRHRDLPWPYTQIPGRNIRAGLERRGIAFPDQRFAGFQLGGTPLS